ncbi:hypothetical protein Bca4012_095055 [Brassica carinata]
MTGTSNHSFRRCETHTTGMTSDQTPAQGSRAPPCFPTKTNPPVDYSIGLYLGIRDRQVVRSVHEPSSISSHRGSEMEKTRSDRLFNPKLRIISSWSYINPHRLSKELWELSPSSEPRLHEGSS